MVRRYEEPVEVRVAPVQPDTVLPGDRPTGSAGATGSSDGAGQEAGAQRVPDAFVWRGRLYVVREILGHWRERRAWWRTALDGDADVGPLQGKLPQAQAQAQAEAQARVLVSRSARQDLEQHVWRVEASPGRMHGTGVYDLACERPARDDPVRDDPARDETTRDNTADSWRIVRVAD